MNTCDTAVQVHGVPQRAEIQYHTHTCMTHFGNTAGLPIQVFSPRHFHSSPNLRQTDQTSSFFPSVSNGPSRRKMFLAILTALPLNLPPLLNILPGQTMKPKPVIFLLRNFIHQTPPPYHSCFDVDFTHQRVHCKKQSCSHHNARHL
jgi:hypothetical protein